MTIYEIDKALEGLIDPETGELLDYDSFIALCIQREHKIEHTALWIKNLVAEAEAIKAEISILKARQQAAIRKETRLKEYLAEILNGEKFKTPRCSITHRKSSAVEIADEKSLVSWLEENGHDDAVSYAAPTVSKSVIKEILKSRRSIPFCKMVDRIAVQIK